MSLGIGQRHVPAVGEGPLDSLRQRLPATRVSLCADGEVSEGRREALNRLSARCVAEHCCTAFYEDIDGHESLCQLALAMQIVSTRVVLSTPLDDACDEERSCARA